MASAGQGRQNCQKWCQRQQSASLPAGAGPAVVQKCWPPPPTCARMAPPVTPALLLLKVVPTIEISLPFCGAARQRGRQGTGAAQGRGQQAGQQAGISKMARQEGGASCV
jgi:hypothetical protein